MSAQHHPHPLPENYRQAAAAAKAWPFAEARKLSLRLKREQTQQSSALKRIVRFQTGYGPSGLPHIGTFGEVLRTSMVRNAFAVLEPDLESELVCFSDDMDGLRKIPETISNPESLRPHLGKPLSAVPDPFGCCSSYAQHNNKALKKFLDDFGFTYTFQSATEGYRSGKFDRGLQRMLECYQPVLALMQASLGEERKQSYSPFLPLCPESGVVLQVPVEEVDATKGTILYRHLDGSLRETSVFGGKCKLQWKPDWAMRWFVLDIDYEMYGKDLIPSAEMSQQILRLMSKNTPPAGFAYELFLDEKGEKISKSRGNGLTIEQWLTYASADSLAYYMYKKPKTAKRLFFDCIPRCLDEYLGDRRRFDKASEAQEKVENPVFHIERQVLSTVPESASFSLLQNLVSAVGLQSRALEQDKIHTAWMPLLQRELEAGGDDLSASARDTIQRLWDYALAYDRDFVRPSCAPRAPAPSEKVAIDKLIANLQELPADAALEEIQKVVYAVGCEEGYEDKLRAWFEMLYEVLLGQSTGPRFASFLKIYGLEAGIAMLQKAARS